MRKDKKARLERAGWKVGSVQDFLGLSEVEAALVELKLSLSRGLRLRRTLRRPPPRLRPRRAGASTFRWPPGANPSSRTLARSVPTHSRERTLSVCRRVRTSRGPKLRRGSSMGISGRLLGKPADQAGISGRWIRAGDGSQKSPRDVEDVSLGRVSRLPGLKG